MIPIELSLTVALLLLAEGTRRVVILGGMGTKYFLPRQLKVVFDMYIFNGHRQHSKPMTNLLWDSW